MMEQHEYMDKARQYRYVGVHLGNNYRSLFLVLFAVCEFDKHLSGREVAFNEMNTVQCVALIRRWLSFPSQIMISNS